jgi:hypothetical protein
LALSPAAEAPCASWAAARKLSNCLKAASPSSPATVASRPSSPWRFYNVGRHHEATRTLLRLVAASSTAPSVEQYRAAIEYYADDLDKIEGAG